MKIVKNKNSEITKGMFGLFFEDINYAADGGLYAEMIENRSFEAREAFGNPGSFYHVEDSGYAWSPVSQTEEKPVMKYVMGTALSEANPHYLRFTATKANQGFANKAYDGIYLKKGETVNVVFYARAVRYEGDFTVSIREYDKDNSSYKDVCSKTIKAKKAIPFHCFWEIELETDDEKLLNIKNMDKAGMANTSDWVKYECTLTADSDAKAAKFVIELDKEGAVDFDFISVIPQSAKAGIFRRDLYEALEAMNPGFIRFPGGCIVEGISLENRYNWKNTVGRQEDRKYIPNLWAFDDDGSKTDLDAQRVDSHYGQSYGIGFYEYFLLCEMLGAKPLPVLGVGVACQFRSKQVVDVNDEEFEKYVQDSLDLIEFANGSTDTKWGALRAKMGHPEPFNLEYLAVGNEQWETELINLFERNDIFEKAIHDNYPEIKILGSAGPVVDFKIADLAWDYYRGREEKKPGFSYAVDEHYYKSPEWMYENVSMYDNYPLNPGVFAGEYAAHTKDRANSMESALAEASFMTGLEINSRVIKLASYAPLFNRVGHSQWKPDMIWFDSTEVYLTPNYYVQSMYSNFAGDYTLEFTDEMRALREKGIYVSPTIKENGEIILKLVNTTETEVVLPLEDEAGEGIVTSAKLTILEAAGEVPEDMPQPTKVTEKEIAINKEITLPKFSFTVVRI